MEKQQKINELKKQIESNKETDFEFLSNSYEELINLLKENIISDEKIVETAEESNINMKANILDLELSLQKLCKLIMEKIQQLDCEIKVNLEGKKSKRNEKKALQEEIVKLKANLIPRIVELKELEEKKLKKLTLSVVESKKTEDYIKVLDEILAELNKDQTLDEFLQNENISNLKVKNYGEENKNYVLEKTGLGLGITIITLTLILSGVAIGKKLKESNEEENNNNIINNIESTVIPLATPTPTPTTKPVVTPTLTPTPTTKPVVTPTLTPTPTTKPVVTPTLTPTPVITLTPTPTPTFEEVLDETKIDYKEYKQNLKDINSKYVIEKGILTLEQAIALSYYTNGESLSAKAKESLESEDILPIDSAKIITDNANAINNVVASVLNNAYAGKDNDFILGDFIINEDQKKTVCELENIANKLYNGTKDEKINAYSKLINLCLLRRSVETEDGFIINLNNLSESLEYEVMYTIVLPSNVYAGTEGINEKCSYPTEDGRIITNANDAFDYVISILPNPVAINTSKNCQKIYN